jgi:hypothetical protein
LINWIATYRVASPSSSRCQIVLTALPKSYLRITMTYVSKLRDLKSMIQTLRVDKDLNALIGGAASAVGKTRSEIIRIAIEQYCRQVLADNKKSAYDKLVEGGFEPLVIGPADLSTNKERLRTNIRERFKRSSR